MFEATKTESDHDIVLIGGTADCQWEQSWPEDESQFSVIHLK